MNPSAGHSRTARGKARLKNRAGASILLFVAGSVCLLLALGSFVTSWYFVSTARPATAVVSEWREQKVRGSFRYAPTFMFRDAAGKQHTKSSPVFDSEPRWRVGALVPILYSPANPQHARLNRYRDLWGRSTMAAILGAGCLLAGWGVRYWNRAVVR